MHQILFSIPIKAISDALPDLPPAVFFLGVVALIFLGVGIGRWLQPGKWYTPALYLAGGVLLALAGIRWLAQFQDNIPIFGYGSMLFLAFVFCTWLASWLGKREGIDPQRIQDLAIWIFLFGIVGGRITYIIQNREDFTSWGQYFRIWEGGLVFYGSAVGGAIGYFVAYRFINRGLAPAARLSTWKMADIIAPCGALGLCLGRVGCLLNGCCYGNVACPECYAVSFPLSSAPRFDMVKRGYQTTAGFTFKVTSNDDPAIVDAVEPDSPAAAAGLQSGDLITGVNGEEVKKYSDIVKHLTEKWPRGKNDLSLTVLRDSRTLDLNFTPETIGLHPTQVYESISTGLLFFLLLAFYPFKQRDGMVMVLFMVGYAVHRFLNEMLRTDTPPVALDMTLSENISIIVLAAAGLLALVVWLRPRPQAVSSP